MWWNPFFNCLLWRKTNNTICPVWWSTLRHNCSRWIVTSSTACLIEWHFLYLSMSCNYKAALIRWWIHSRGQTPQSLCPLKSSFGVGLDSGQTVKVQNVRNYRSTIFRLTLFLLSSQTVLPCFFGIWLWIRESFKFEASTKHKLMIIIGAQIIFNCDV